MIFITQATISLIILSFLLRLPVYAQYRYTDVLPEFKTMKWKIERLGFELLPPQNSPKEGQGHRAWFDIYRTIAPSGDSFHIVPSSLKCENHMSSEEIPGEWSTCWRQENVAWGDEHFGKENRRLMKWRTTDLKFKPGSQWGPDLPKNISATGFESIKFEIAQGIPVHMALVPYELVELLTTSFVLTSDMFNCMESRYPPSYACWLKRADGNNGSPGCILHKDPILPTQAQTCGFYSNVTSHGNIWGEDFQNNYGF